MISIQFLHIFRTFLYSFLTFFYFYDSPSHTPSSHNHNHRAHTSGSDGPEAKRAHNETCDSFAHMPAMQGRRFARCFCRYSGNIASDISYMITRTLDSRAFAVHQGFCFLNIFLQGVLCVSYTLKRKLTTSPSFMTYSLPSERRKPFSLAAAREPPTSMSLS